MLIPNLGFGGAQRVFYTMSLYLSKHYRVVECVFNFESGHAFKTGNEIVSLDIRGGANFILKLWQFLRRIWALRKLKKKLNPAVCISHLEGADLINVISQCNEETITWVHGSKKYDENIEGLLGFIRHRLLIPFTYKRADKVVTVSNAIKDELIEYYGVSRLKIETLYNFFDVEGIQSKTRVPIDLGYKEIFENGKTLVYSGRLARQKNPQNLLKWFAQFNYNKEYKLVIIGDGELRVQLIRLCNELRLKTYSAWDNLLPDNLHEVYFLGFQQNPFNLIVRSTAFILPSLWEGFPMALGEAMACGVPVISADCPTGPREMLLNSTAVVDLPSFAEYGLLLPILHSETFEVWNVSVGSLLNSPERLKYYAAKSRFRADSFSQNKNAQHLFTVINSVINK